LLFASAMNRLPVPSAVMPAGLASPAAVAGPPSPVSAGAPLPAIV
jgi:hypothetical protein